MRKRKDKWNATARYLAGEMDMKEEIAFREQIEAGAHSTELKQMEKSWKYFNNHTGRGEADTDKAWEKLYLRLENDGLLEEPRTGRTGFSLAPALRIAATILLILAVGVPTLYLGIRHNGNREQPVRQLAEKGIRSVDLPDGSRVFLNQGSEISYPEGVANGRTVSLKGEAFFEVMSDPVNPFTVRAGKVVVSVLGTSFNVKGSGRSDEVEVYVESGKVRMALENSAEFITLEPGEVGRSENAHLSSSLQTDPNYISWKTKDFKFVDESLGLVLKELEESYHVRIHTDGIPVDAMRITSTYREQSIDAILETIGTAFSLDISKKEDQYYLEK
jgi:transmembrane sensor